MTLKLWKKYKTRDRKTVVLLEWNAVTKEFWGIDCNNPNGWISWNVTGKFDGSEKHPLDIVGERGCPPRRDREPLARRKARRRKHRTEETEKNGSTCNTRTL